MSDPSPAELERFTRTSLYPIALAAAALLAAAVAHALLQSLSPWLHAAAVIAAAILGLVGADWLARIARR